MRASMLVRQVANAVKKPNHLLSLSDLSVSQIDTVLQLAAAYKKQFRNPAPGAVPPQDQPLKGKTVALMFTKRSTRTRVASESSCAFLGAHPMFLGSQDIQLGVNESLMDTSKVVSSMVHGIMARVDGHEDVEGLAEYSTVPVINALSDLYHPTQILADLLTMIETFSTSSTPSLSCLKGLNVAWVGDSNNILNDMIVSFGRLGINLNIATPKGYNLDQRVLATQKQGLQSEGGDGVLQHFHVPEEALKGAHVAVTDTWISMGQEAEKEKRLKDFQGFQITKSLLERSGANADWKFMHCLPRKPQEVDDDVFYDEKRSLVFPEAENRKWTIAALFALYFGKGGVVVP